MGVANIREKVEALDKDGGLNGAVWTAIFEAVSETNKKGRRLVSHNGHSAHWGASAREAWIPTQKPKPFWSASLAPAATRATWCWTRSAAAARRFTPPKNEPKMDGIDITCLAFH